MSQLLIYKASAGSGKTFTLAVEYIKHLILYSRAYRNILAVTFTNKATAEMKERILSQLYGIWMGDKGSTPYLNRIVEDTGLTEQHIRTAAGEALMNMLHDYSYFRVETIDSFFQSVMRNLARELELSPNLNIELNREDVLSEAVDSMIEKLQANSPVLLWLLDYIQERIDSDKRWNVSDEIKKFGNNIFDEEYIEKGGNLRERLKNPAVIKEYRKKLNTLQEEAFKEMAGYAEQFEQSLESHGLLATDFKRGDKGISSYFRKLQNGELTEKVRNATVEECLENAENWTTKTSKLRGEIASVASSTLIPLLQTAEKSRVICNRTINSCRLSLQHLNKLQLLTNIDEEVRYLNKENNRFLLSDTNALLHRLIKDDDSSFVFEKIGSSIRHVMIDEFQDTSRMQWGNFKLLLLEGLSQGSDSLIVGDVKQSIYRWRNGDWGILNGLNDKLGHFPINVQTLKTNRRSESNIIGFNNLFFTEAVEYLNQKHIAELDEPCEALLKAYQDVVQESPRPIAKGYVKVNFLDKDEEKDYTEATLQALGAEVNTLLSKGVALNDIAILVRKNKAIPRIAEYFDKEMQCKIVSNEAFRLDASLAIQMMMNALRILSDPTDAVAKAQLTIAYQNEVLKNNCSFNELLLHPEKQFLPQAFADNMASLQLMPLYELLEELFVQFGMERIDEQDAYIFAFFDAVMEFLQNNSADLDSFIRFWDEKLCAKTIPGGELDGIRIFSIHKSKGLEFHTVIIPFCDWKLEGETNMQLVWGEPKEAPYNEIDLVPITYSAQMSESAYRESYLHERLQLWVDHLNLLYVAFTRAEKNMIIFSKKAQKGTVSEILLNALSTITAKAEVEWDEDMPYEYGEVCLSEDTKATNNTNRLLQKPAKRAIKMESIRPQVVFRQSNRSADFIQGIDENDDSYSLINKGRLLHTLFAAIETEKDIEPSIQQLVFEGVIGSKEQEMQIRELTAKAFSTEQVKEWYSGAWKLFNECAIIYKEKNGTVQIRRPDRVMMQNNRVVVVDFKFGKQQKKYAKQVKEYIALLKQMGHTDVEGYIWYVEEDTIESITD